MVRISWDPPAPLDRNGVISGYNINITRVEDGTRKVYQVSAPSTSLQIQGSYVWIALCSSWSVCWGCNPTLQSFYQLHVCNIIRYKEWVIHQFWQSSCCLRSFITCTQCTRDCMWCIRTRPQHDITFVHHKWFALPMSKLLQCTMKALKCKTLGAWMHSESHIMRAS